MSIEEKIIDKLKRNWPLVLLVLYFSLFYFNYIFLATADLGRHIVNGREILAGNTAILAENFYSYAQPNFSFPNHHWLFGVVAHLIEQSFGFSGLTLLNAFLYVGAFSFAILLALRKSNMKFAVIAGILAIPLITSRTEVRPESISIFMFSGFFFALNLITDHFQKKKSQLKKMSWYLPVVASSLIIGQIIWTNSHLFFIFGPFISGLFLTGAIWKNIVIKKSKILTPNVKFLSLLTLGLFLATLINPHGISGSLSPFHIFDNYGYLVAENQSTWFMLRVKNNIPKFSYFIIAAVLQLITFFGVINFKKEKSGKITSTHSLLVPLISFLVFGVMTQFVNRISSFFGIVFIPVLAQNLFIIYQKYQSKIVKLLDNSLILMITSPLVILGIIMLFYFKLLSPSIPNIGLGLAPNTNASAEFFKNAELSGPIFNNYDLGGYLIYYLFPEEKVFVDNRPESYPNEFFKNEHIAAQETEEDWERVSEKYGFETIYYFRLDSTNWAQKFLLRRVQDPNWVPVYVDSYILIFVKNNDKNSQIIEKHKLPDEMFVMKDL